MCVFNQDFSNFPEVINRMNDIRFYLNYAVGVACFLLNSVICDCQNLALFKIEV